MDSSQKFKCQIVRGYMSTVCVLLEYVLGVFVLVIVM